MFAMLMTAAAEDTTRVLISAYLNFGAIRSNARLGVIMICSMFDNG